MLLAPAPTSWMVNHGSQVAAREMQTGWAHASNDRDRKQPRMEARVRDQVGEGETRNRTGCWLACRDCQIQKRRARPAEDCRPRPRNRLALVPPLDQPWS